MQKLSEKLQYQRAKTEPRISSREGPKLLGEGSEMPKP